jgi:hypothetical protein
MARIPNKSPSSFSRQFNSVWSSRGAVSSSFCWVSFLSLPSRQHHCNMRFKADLLSTIKEHLDESGGECQDEKRTKDNPGLVSIKAKTRLAIFNLRVFVGQVEVTKPARHYDYLLWLR